MAVGEPSEPTPRYLPEELADWLRRATIGVANPEQRGELVHLAEVAFHVGHAGGYDRGYRDARAETEERYRPQPLEPTGLLTRSLPPTTSTVVQS